MCSIQVHPLEGLLVLKWPERREVAWVEGDEAEGEGGGKDKGVERKACINSGS